MELRQKMTKTLKPAQILVLSFGGMILLGALLLMLPISSQTNQVTSFMDALFTATSAVCVTGLAVVDTGTYWSVFGKTIILVLIQMGGLGFMTMTTSIAIILGKRIGLRNRMIMQEALNQFSISGVIRLTKYVIMATFSVELIGAILLSIRFVPLYGIKNGLYYSIFHSVSAFCNAGFDIIGGYRSLTPFARDPIVNIVIMTLIILGGLGFAVIADLSTFKTYRKLSLHTKLVLLMTVSLILFGFVMIFTLEYNNPQTIGSFSFGEKIIASMFHSISPRTAGFNTLDLTQLTVPTRFITMILMFIGGSPGSTAGGIKTTTFGMLILYVISVFRGNEDINFVNRRISKEAVSKALAVVFIATFLVVIMTFLMTVFEGDVHPLEEIVFETISAFGTVGLSLGITPTLSVMGKIILTVMMFLGRLGPLTIVIAISKKASQSKKDLLRYPEGKIIVG
ncbi:MAG: Trk family potassium uptake protein [Clostridiales bacterium 38-18]|nr:MAG: Trk family potassium uptake protein [Clostridiales bacterium 38-18]